MGDRTLETVRLELMLENRTGEVSAPTSVPRQQHGPARDRRWALRCRSDARARSLRLHPLVVLVATTAGTLLLGLMGAILAAPLSSAFLDVFGGATPTDQPG